MKQFLKIKSTSGNHVRTERQGAANKLFKFKRKPFDAVAYAAVLEVLG
jgi:hypothetical protein